MQEYFAFQDTETENPAVDTSTVGGGIGEQRRAKLGVAFGSFHDGPHPSGQIGIRHSEFTSIRQDCKQVEESGIVRLRQQSIPGLGSRCHLLFRGIRQPWRQLFDIGLRVGKVFVGLHAFSFTDTVIGNDLEHLIEFSA
ncbi:hypothetical protein D3C81_1570280 [compost metagenome]